MRAWPLLLLAACGRVGFTGADAADAAGGDADAPPAAPRFLFHLDGLTGHDVAEASGQDGYAFNEADVTATPGKIGGALHFDGVAYASYVILPSTDGFCRSVPSLLGSITVAAWVSFDSLHDWGGYTLGDVAIMQGSVGGTGGAWGLGATNGCGPETAGFTLAFDDAHRFTCCGATTVSTATWYFVVGVYDASALTVQVYLNGVDDTAGHTTISSAIGSSLNPGVMCPYFGAPGNQRNLLIGSLDEVRIYDRALSAAEIAALYTP